MLTINIEEGESMAQKQNLGMDEIEASVDQLLAKSDRNFDGMISWEEYIYIQRDYFPTHDGPTGYIDISSEEITDKNKTFKK